MLIGGLLAAAVGLLLPDRGESPADTLWLRSAKGFFLLLAIGALALGIAPWRQVVGSWWASCRRRPSRWARHVRLAVGLGVLAALACWLHDVAYSHDHAVTCFRAWHFWREVLGRGRLGGWSHVVAAGFPVGELSPAGPELWVTLFRAATLGLLSWPHTYALAVAGALLAAGAALYRFTRSFFGRAVAIIAASLWVLDPGGYQGGWLTWVDVWPLTLALGFTLLALVDLAVLLAADAGRPWRRPFLAAAWWTMAALLTHRLAIVVLAVALPALLAAELLRNVRLGRTQVLRGLAAAALGVGFAAWHWIPRLARESLVQDLAARGLGLAELARRLVDLCLFANGWAPLVVLGLLGGVLVLRGRAAAGLFLVLCTSSFVLLASDLALRLCPSARWAESLLKLELPRLLLVAKLFCLPLAAYALVGCWRRSTARGRSPGSPGRQVGVVVLLAALGAPFAVPVARQGYRTHVSKPLEHRGRTPRVLELQAVAEWSRRERQASGDAYRMAYALADRAETVVALAPVLGDTPFYQVGPSPAQPFRNVPTSDEPEVLAALGVKYLVTDQEKNDPDFTRVQSFGELGVYRFARYRARQPFTLLGSGQADLVELSPERIAVRLQGTAAGARLKLHVAAHPRWQATLDGRELLIEPAPIHDLAYPFLMEVPVADGELVFRYVRRTADGLGLAITLLALALAGLVADRRRRVLDPLARLVAPVRVGRRPFWVAGAVLAGGAALVLARRPTATAPAPEPLLDQLAATDDLVLAGFPCAANGPQRWQCGDEALRVDVVDGDDGSHLCWSTPSQGPLALSVQRSLGRFVSVDYAARRDESGSIRIYVAGALVGDTASRPAEAGATVLQADTRVLAGRVAQVRVELAGAPLHCFDVHIVR